MGSAIVIAICALAVSFIAFVTWAMHSRWLAGRGWVYNKHNPRPRGMGTLGLLESIYQPSIEHVIEERSSERARKHQDESGAGDPEAG